MSETVEIKQRGRPAKAARDKLADALDKVLEIANDLTALEKIDITRNMVNEMGNTLEDALREVRNMRRAV